MAVEIERKFLVRDDSWRREARSRQLLRQGYLAVNERCSVRVRVAGAAGWLTVKSMTPGPARAEYELPLPGEDAEQLLQTLCPRPWIEKWRNLVIYENYEWEVDEFLGDNSGLVVAEIELEMPDEGFARPPWLGREVTGDVRYYNFKLATEPFGRWAPGTTGAPG
ncbi:MAG TPA: CYTH domain-containing protein [Steroidobacteraceae bacterium]|nr:CYTH domain-containing protein [Steroidobacteraceae bacterium]